MMVECEQNEQNKVDTVTYNTPIIGSPNFSLFNFPFFLLHAASSHTPTPSPAYHQGKSKKDRKKVSLFCKRPLTQKETLPVVFLERSGSIDLFGRFLNSLQFGDTMSSVKNTVKESFMGKTDEHHMSHQIKTNFYHHSHKDEQTGELYMTEDDFINAVAPKQEDYVSVCPRPLVVALCTRSRTNSDHLP